MGINVKAMHHIVKEIVIFLINQNVDYFLNIIQKNENLLNNL